MPRKRIPSPPPTIKQVDGLSSLGTSDCKPKAVVKPKPVAIDLHTVLQDAGLIAKPDELIVPPGKRIVATLQTKDGPKYILEPNKPFRRI